MQRRRNQHTAMSKHFYRTITFFGNVSAATERINNHMLREQCRDMAG
jgi:hypothetical protein